MAFGFYENDQSVLARVRARETAAAYRQAQMVSVTPDFTAMLESYVDAYGDSMDAGTMVALAKAGISPTDPSVQQIADASFEKKRKSGFFDKVGDVVGAVGRPVGAVAGAAGRFLDQGLGDIDESLLPAAKGTVRTGFVVLESGLQELQTFVRAAGWSGVRLAEQQGDTSVMNRLRNLADPTRWDDLGETFTDAYADAGSSSGREAAMAMLRGEDVDLGSGFLPAGEIAEDVRTRANRLTLKVGDAQFGGPGNRSITPGRVVAAKVAEPGETQFNIVSGLLDAGVAWFGDPAAAAAGVARTTQAGARVGRAQRALRSGDGLGGAARELTTTPSFAGVVDRSLQSRAAEGVGGLMDEVVGLVRGTRKTVQPDRVDQWLTKGGQPFAEKVAATDDFYELWQATGKKMPVSLTLRLADATTPQEVMDILRPALGTELRDAPEFLGFKVRKAHGQGVRLAGEMPGAYIDPNDLDEGVEQLDRWLRNAKVPPELRNRSVERFARTPTRQEMVSTLGEIMGEVEDHLAGVVRKTGGASSTERARRFTTMFNQEVERTKTYFIDEIAENRQAAGVLINGEPQALQSPFLFTEYLNNLVPLPDAREIRAATSRLGRLVDNPFFARTTGAMDSLMGGWKRMVLLRGAYTVRVIGEEQLRMSASGLDSMFAHPMSAISALLGNKDATRKLLSGTKRQVDVLGESFDEAAEFQQALNKGWSGWVDDTVYDREFVTFAPGDEGYQRAWAQAIGELYSDPVAKRVAAAEGNLDDVKDWFFRREGRKFRRPMVESHAELATKAGSDAYIDTLWEGVQYRTGSDPILMQAVATGRIGDGVIGRLNETGRWSFEDGFLAHLNDVVGPEAVKGQRIITAGGTAGIGEVWDNATGFLFSYLNTKPTNYLSRSPAFRQKYWERIEEMLPYMDEATRAKALGRAEGVVDGAQLKRMRATQSLDSASIAELDDADFLAKSYALDETKALLYDLSDRGQFFDTFRLIFPFGEAWREVLTRWAKIGAANPRAIRRGQQIITSARGAGVFHKDVNGEEVFCADETTEVLTQRGWLHHSDLTTDDTLLSLDPDTDQIQWEPVLGVHRFNYDGDLIRWSGRVDALTTGNHRWLVEDWRLNKPKRAGVAPKREFWTTDQISAQKQRPVVVGGGTPACFADAPTHSDEFVELIGWVVTEGNYSPNGNAVVVSQSESANPDKTERIRLLAKHYAAAGCTATERRRQRHGMECEFYFGKGIASRIREASPDRGLTPEFLRALTESQAHLLLETLLDGDGHRRPSGYRCWAQKPGHRVDGFQMLTAMLGIRTQSLLYPEQSDVARITLHKVRHAYTHNARPEHYQGVVWCPSVSTGIWFARRNGNTYWTGNTYPFSRQISKALIGMPIDLNGRVAGLSLMTEVLPGVGPVVQLPAAAILPETPDWDFARQFISPFGEQDYSNGILESFFPGYAKNIMQSFQAGDERLFANTVGATMDYLVSTGEYDTADPDDMRRLTDDATKLARNTYLLRGLVQFGAPTSPQPEFLVEDKDGDLDVARVVLQDFYAMQEEDYDSAVGQFLERYGTDVFTLTQGKSFSIAPRLPVTKAAAEWERANGDLVGKYGTTWGFFAPAGDTDDFDYQAYTRQFRRGDRVSLTPEQRIALAQARVGRHIYEQAEARLSEKPTPEEREWLAAVKERIREEYPGFGEMVPGLPARADTETVIAELRRATTDPKLAGTRQAQAARLYLTARDQALSYANEIGVKTLEAQAAEPARLWLAEVGRRMTVEYPEFQEMFDVVFSREVEA